MISQHGENLMPPEVRAYRRQVNSFHERLESLAALAQPHQEPIPHYNQRDVAVYLVGERTKYLLKAAGVNIYNYQHPAFKITHSYGYAYYPAFDTKPPHKRHHFRLSWSV